MRSDFLWGSATSAHQVEGDCLNNTWFRFESAVDARGMPRIVHGQKAGTACQHWNRYPEDIQLMKALGLNAYRFSVEWSKIEVLPGVFDETVLDHYGQMVDALIMNGVVPMVTLHHFTNPLWFEELGGFLSDSSPEHFARFVARVVRRLGKHVRFWCTINEPSVFAVNGYVTGEYPPGIQDARKGLRVLRNLLRAHSEAYLAIKQIEPDAQTGLPVNIFVFEPAARWNPLDLLGTYVADRCVHHAVLRYLNDGCFDFSFPGVARERFQGPPMETIDFVGLNYYTRFFLRFNPWRPPRVVPVGRSPREDLTDMGWEIYPEGLYRSMKVIREHTTRPLYVTENGIADDSDTKRSEFIRSHLRVMDRAIGEGIDVRGYFYWSLLDNFEWSHGFTKRFGLYSVDFPTQTRTLRPGSMAYPEMISRLK